MIMPFAYVKPGTLDEALEALQTDNSKPLAGGTALLVDMRDGMERPDLVVDVKGLEELNAFSVVPGAGVTIGARTTLNVLADNRELKASCPVISEAAVKTATYQLRNKATLVGNICKASPAADMAPPLYILGAQVVITGPQGERKVPMTDFMIGVNRNALKKGEVVLRVEIPPIPKAKMAFLKKQRIKGHDLSVVNVAGLAEAQSGTLRLCVGACAETPVLLEGTDQLYREAKDMEKLGDRVADHAVSSISPIDDVRASAAYRRDIVRVFVKRIVKQICS
jgi:carbon-monoxide dehydrogenase medium subunit